MRLLLVLLLLAPMTGCGLERALRESAAWKAEAAKLQVEKDAAAATLDLCDKAYEASRAEAESLKEQLGESSVARLVCQTGAREL